MKLLMLGSGSYKSGLTYYRLLALAKELGKLDYDVYAVVPSADKYNDYTPDKKASVKGIKLVQPWQFVTKNDFVNLLPYLITATVSSIRIKPQLIYLFKPTPITIIGLIPKIIFRVPLVLDLDDLGSEVMRLQKQSVLQVKLVSMCERIALRYADAVVVASTYLETLVKEQYPHKSVLVLSNGVDPQLYKPAKNLKVWDGVYYFGVLNRINLIETFLRALPQTLKQVPDTRVTILGDGSALPESRSLATKLGIEDQVTFVGWTLAEDLHKYVQAGDLAVCIQPDIPTVRACSNVKVFQYMSLGSVPVVSDVGDLGRYVKAGQGTEQVGVVVPPEDPDALARSLVSTLKNKKGRAEMAKKARRAAMTEYAWSSLAKKLDQFLQSQVDAKTVMVRAEVRDVE